MVPVTARGLAEDTQTGRRTFHRLIPDHNAGEYEKVAASMEIRGCEAKTLAAGVCVPAVGVAFGGLGEAFAAVPATIKGAGCSIWFRQDGRLTQETLAGAIAALWIENPPAFITPDGDPVQPQAASGNKPRGPGAATSSFALSSTH